MKMECDALFWGALLISCPSLLLCFGLFCFFFNYFIFIQTLEDCMSARMILINVVIIFICKYAKKM